MVARPASAASRAADYPRVARRRQGYMGSMSTPSLLLLQRRPQVLLLNNIYYVWCGSFVVLPSIRECYRGLAFKFQILRLCMHCNTMFGC